LSDFAAIMFCLIFFIPVLSQVKITQLSLLYKSDNICTMDRKGLLLLGLLLFISPLTHAVELTGALWTHDPSRIMKDSTRYWFYSTGNGVPASFSDNLSNWSVSAITVFQVGTWPSWINTAVPGFGGHFWAPDLIYMNNAYYLYYSCSTFGSSRSAIGVARSPSLNEPEWTDLGMVVSSNGTSAAINAIDPSQDWQRLLSPIFMEGVTSPLKPQT
jgi:hypothetical protein